MQRMRDTKPRVLLASTSSWPWAMRLAEILEASGCCVYAVCAPRQPLSKLPRHRTFRYKPLSPTLTLQHAIASSDADIVIPCDDRVVAHLHQIQTASSDRCFPPSIARHDLITLAKKVGVDVPDSCSLDVPTDLEKWLANHEAPWVLKVDGTTGGRGVRIMDTVRGAWKAYYQLQQPVSFLVAAKRWIMENEPFWLADRLRKQEKPRLSAQSFISGTPANCAVFSWKGEVLACIIVEVIQTRYPTGPASVVRIVERPEILRASRMLAGLLNISGMFGLDFMIDNKTDVVYLIEMNARATPLAHIQLGCGRDIPSALHAVLSNSKIKSKMLNYNEIIAY